ncbi:MAG: ATP-binding protein [Lachnospiraceae bacterium]|nr:ATP-binding protein [Lachnospiraceae bacterium]
MQELKIEAKEDNLYLVMEALEEYIRGQCSDDVRDQLLICVDELFINIAHYAYEGEVGEAIIQMEIREEPKRLKVVFLDRGIPYNPLEKEDPDITLSAEDRKIGGLGIFMVKDFTDYQEYEYVDGYNKFTIEKLLF